MKFLSNLFTCKHKPKNLELSRRVLELVNELNAARRQEQTHILELQNLKNELHLSDRKLTEAHGEINSLRKKLEKVNGRRINSNKVSGESRRRAKA